MKQQFLSTLLGFAMLLSLGSCTSLKPYERIYVNDPEMQMGVDVAKGFQTYIYSIREGAIPAGSPKAVGGCGCN